MPLNTRQRQTPDKAGADTDGVLPAEEERPEAEGIPAADEPDGPGPDGPDGPDAAAATRETAPAEGEVTGKKADTHAGKAIPDAGEEAAEGGGEAAAGAPSPRSGRGRRLRAWQDGHPVAARVIGISVTVLAGLLVVVSFLLPNRPENFRIAEFTRLPVEALIGAVVLTVLPRRPRLIAAWLGGVVLGVLTVLNLLDIGFYQYLGRGFNIILDWSLLTDAYAYLQDTLGGAGALGVLLVALAITVVVLGVSALAVVRLGNLMARHRATTTRGVLVLSMVWMTCQALSLQVGGVPLAAEHTVTMLQYRSDRIRETVRDERDFARTAKVDAFGGTPGSQLVPDLRGKDMIFTFIESYGRSAVEDPIMAPGVDRTLDTDTQALAKAGFHAKSGWLTSATYGGSSWLGHSTFMSGLWINNQNRYRTVSASDHLTLTEAFKKTGAWDTVGIMPGVQKGWPEAKWYGLDKVYNAFQMGYKGPKFSWSTMPDQYALEQFQKREHGRKRDKPLMSFVILTSSHQPWAPIPKMVGWDRLGNGSVFDAIQKAGNNPADIIADSTRSKEEYGKTIQYSVTALTQWLERYGNDNTVLVFLGDHQPMARVSGNHASRDVPCAIVAKDPKVFDKIAGWGWSDGLRPAHNAPVWKMSAFRDRFLTAYGSTPHPSKG
ncbi:sulfatase-like hydrolase/transferase [Streptomyces sp. NPDC002519]